MGQPDRDTPGARVMESPAAALSIIRAEPPAEFVQALILRTVRKIRLAEKAADAARGSARAEGQEARRDQLHRTLALDERLDRLVWQRLHRLDEWLAELEGDQC